MDRIFQFEHEDGTVLGFDTGLDAQAFAQAKIAQFITQNGYIIYPDGKIEEWHARGVIERKTGLMKDNMVVWGPAFPGERLDLFISGKEDISARLDSLRFWIRARILLEEAQARIGQELPRESRPPYPWPAGAFYVPAPSQSYPQGCLFFPPERLLKRCIEVDGEGAWMDSAEQWVHPDLEGAPAAAFAAGTMLYCILCGAPPFLSRDFNTLREDIRGGVFLPPHLACPGLVGEAELILNETLTVKRDLPQSGRRAVAGKGIASEAADSFSRNNRIDKSGGSGAAASVAVPGTEQKAGLERLGGLAALLEKGSKSGDVFVRNQSAEERIRLEAERERYIKTSARKVSTKRFLRRNRTAIAVTFGAVLLAALISGSIIRNWMELPTTKGMTEEEVVSTYYGAFGTLDHTLMQACVINKAGKGDIDMITNLFVMSRVRMAYETTGAGMIPAQQWIDEGSPPTEHTVFGVSGLGITELSRGDTETRCRVFYTLWAPARYFQSSEEMPLEENPAAPVPQMPVGTSYTDEVTLTFYRGAWRISAIMRREG
ncbi:MAG: hypothetical protein LBQ88_06815 [Treponema sp.]|jgi:hypothetical protein|nr:hypothetical protein [Treponema sp.]